MFFNGFSLWEYNKDKVYLKQLQAYAKVHLVYVLLESISVVYTVLNTYSYIAGLVTTLSHWLTMS